MLNLINIAFYAHERNSSSNAAEQNREPAVTVSTKRADGKVNISVKDNGNGIPQKILDKIFQPFFTTKPTGQGTGLGLSLAYDIVKAHGEEIKVETKKDRVQMLLCTCPFTDKRELVFKKSHGKIESCNIFPFLMVI